LATWRIQPSRVEGVAHVPPSKSHTLRALLLAAIGSGISTVRNPLDSPDARAMVRACRGVGATVTRIDQGWRVEGVAGQVQAPGIINAGNSGIVLRFVAAMAALGPHPTVFTGDHSVQTRRPVAPLLDGLTQLGATAVSLKGNRMAPMLVQGPVQGYQAHILGADSQPVSAVLMMAAAREGVTELRVDEPGEQPWIGLTLFWLQRLGVRVDYCDYTHFRVHGSLWRGFETTIAGDWSSASYPIAAGLVTGGRLRLTGVDWSDCQGDRHLFDHLPVTIGENWVETDPSKPLWEGGEVDVNPMIDALPLIAVLATQGRRPTRIYNGAIARCKESDRIASIAQQLKMMGARLEEHPDGLTVHPSALQGAKVSSCSDHRIAMALAVAALCARGETTIDRTACVAKSYPQFGEQLHELGAHWL
jgi:3-phosphoshikimate 1-carboxyvinyltransferase